MTDLFFHIKLTCDFSEDREISNSSIAIIAITKSVEFHSIFL
jgi:hypothetical protein